MKEYGEWMYIDSRFLDLGTKWKRMDSFTTLPLYPRDTPVLEN
jgi:hypothetical protein